MGQKLRGANKEFVWVGETSSTLLFGQHLWRDAGARVVVTEGELDCLTISQLQDNKWPVVSIANGAQGAVKCIKKSLEWLESYGTVVFCFDMDEAGQQAARDCAALLSPGKAKIAHLPFKDANECLLNGKAKELLDALWGAKDFRPDGIVNGTELEEKCKQPPSKGAEIPFPLLSEMLHGISGRELYMFTAGSGMGKSTLVHEIGYHLHQQHSWPLGVIALEESNERTGRRYLGMALNKPLHLIEEAIGDAEYNAAFSSTLGRGDIWFYDHFGSTNLDILLSKINFMAVSLGVKCVILDHISIVVSGLDEDVTDERKLIDRLMTHLRQLVERTGIALLAVVHLKRPESGKSWNQGKEVSLTDLRGSGALEQLSDAVISLERDQQGEDSNISLIRVLKNRRVGITGPAGSVLYDHDTGRLTAYEESCPFNKEEEKESTDF